MQLCLLFAKNVCGVLDGTRHHHSKCTTTKGSIDTYKTKVDTHIKSTELSHLIKGVKNATTKTHRTELKNKSMTLKKT
jgi:hypothetical protein